MATDFEVIVPMPPSLANASGQSRHWRTVHRAKKAYLAALDALQGAGKIPPPPASPHIRLQLTSTMHLGARMDMDNAMARHKWPLDWLATRGYVKNDRNIEWYALPEQVVKRGAEYRIHLALRVLEASQPTFKQLKRAGVSAVGGKT